MSDLKIDPRSDASNLRVSFEFFPPKSEKMQQTLWDSITKLQPLNPDFVSVTYGAGGSTRERTHATVAKIASTTNIQAAAHLTCVGASRQEIDDVARGYWEAGIRHIVALRGDPQTGLGTQYIPNPNGYAYASDLVKGLAKVAPFEITVSANPEKHPESTNWQEEIDNLKRKVDAGATRAVTQFFFEADTFLRFHDKMRDAGITIPIIPGLMLQPNYVGIKRMSKMCGIEVPDWYHNLFSGLEDDPQIRQLLMASTAGSLARKLQKEGVRHFHFYTLNKADLAFMVCKILGVQPRA